MNRRTLWLFVVFLFLLYFSADAEEYSAQYQPECAPWESAPAPRECVGVVAKAEDGELAKLGFPIKLSLLLPPGYTRVKEGGIVRVYDSAGVEVVDPDGGGLRLHCHGVSSRFTWHADYLYPVTAPKNHNEVRWRVSVPMLCGNNCSATKIWCGVKASVLPDPEDLTLTDPVWYQHGNHCGSAGCEFRVTPEDLDELGELFGCTGAQERLDALEDLGFVIRYD